MLAFSYLAAANIIIICTLQRKNGKMCKYTSFLYDIRIEKSVFETFHIVYI